jgi:hypothetical protein
MDATSAADSEDSFSVKNSASPRTRALGALAHPVTLVAIAVLAINDHWWKHSYGSWLTGKLSDVVGLAFFPLLVALALALFAPRLSWRTSVRLSLATVGAAFLLIKSTTAGAEFASVVLSGIAGSSTLRADATDLLALPALLVAAWVAHSAMPLRASTARRIVAGVGIGAGLFASVATSQDQPSGADSIEVVDDQIYVHTAQGRFGSESYGDWLIITPGAGGILTHRDYVAEGQRQPLDDSRVVGDVACLDSEPLTCFRPAGGVLGVESSSDGGETWKPDFVVENFQWEALESDTSQSVPKEETLVTYDVAVANVNGEEVVIAANGLDRLSVRHADGTWERVGWWREDSASEVTPLATEPPFDWDTVTVWLWPTLGAIVLIVLASTAWLIGARSRRQRVLPEEHPHPDTLSH